MPKSDLEQLFKQAAAIAAVVPESMQEAAFHRALDALQQQEGTTPPPRGGSTSRRRRSEPAQEKADEDHVTQLLHLDRSRAEDVDDEDGGLNKALALLRVAHRELQIDGLTAPQIAKVLTEKFRWAVSRQAITQALNSAGRLVDRAPSGHGTTAYRLMRLGEEYLDTPTEKRTAPSAGRRTSSRRPRKVAKKGESSSVETAAAASEKTKAGARAAKASKTPTQRKAASRTGPKAAVETLIADGFFSSQRTLSAAQSQLEHQYALRFEATSLSPAFVRLLRQRALTRSRNSDGQYEYVATGT